MEFDTDVMDAARKARNGLFDTDSQNDKDAVLWIIAGVINQERLKGNIREREAFKAGWYTNAVPIRDPDYYSGCENVDFADYQKLGSDRYLLSLDETQEEY